MKKEVDMELVKTYLLRLQTSTDAKIKKLKEYSAGLNKRIKFLEDEHDAEVEAEDDEPESDLFDTRDGSAPTDSLGGGLFDTKDDNEPLGKAKGGLLG